MSARSLIVVALASLASPLLAAEPPLEVTVEIDGQTFDARLGETAEVVIDGKPRSLKLTAKPTRRFAKAGVEFLYPSYFTYELDDSDPGVRIDTVEGPAATVMVESFDTPESGDDLLKSFLDEIRSAYGDALEKESDVRIRLGGRNYAGRRLAAKFAGASLRQDVFPIPGGRILVVQTLLNDDGTVPAEAKLVRDLLAESFRITEPPKGQ